MKIGPVNLGNGKYEFIVWAPNVKEVALKITWPEERLIKMKQGGNNYWKAALDIVRPGTQYLYVLDNENEKPDPASNFQPMDVHGPSEVVAHPAFKWTDSNWKGIQLTRYVIYELHIGTFTREGTFDAAIEKLDDLKRLGITAIEIMPVAQFPGNRNWGYDGVYPYAPQNSYGGPEGLKRLVDACHSRGLAAILDVVYNHFGPSGNYLNNYGPYFTDKYKTPWGMAVNFDEEYSDEVKNYFIENALYWLENYHFDALRLDAVHSIFDLSAKHILEQLSESVEKLYHQNGRKYFLILESDLNDSRLIKPSELGGYGCDAQWCDDFHHALHSILTGERSGYYQDFGKIGHMVEALKNSFVYDGKYSSFRKRTHGNSASERPTYQFVIATQNHDQIGNRAFGQRLSELVSFEALKLAAGTMLLSPYIPMIFMGEEYAEDAPFLYFVSHREPELVQAIQTGRKEEFKAFKWEDEIPDPQDEDTFLQSKLNWNKRSGGKYKTMLEFYEHLIGLRSQIPALANFNREDLDVSGIEDEKIIFYKRTNRHSSIYCIMNFSDIEVTTFAKFPDDRWKRILDSSEKRWMGKGTSTPEIVKHKQDITLNEFSFTLYEKVNNNG